MNFLSPEKNKYILRSYHLSSKSIIPLMLMSFGTYHYDLSIQTPIHIINAVNMGYHSYVSTSCIITDYVKNPSIARFARISSVSLHGLATLGIVYASLKQPYLKYENISKERELNYAYTKYPFESTSNTNIITIRESASK
tara:strand:+ start:48 stop:467 length:420 start_codon:yes stop_codon:yes gene_type:complete